MTRFPLAASALVLVVAAGSASAQSLSELSLEDLMRLDAGRVFGASERSQPVTEAPTSVSFITAEDIARYGYRTLADVLHGVRGMHVTDDRNFSLLGARGFGKPGDYNSRILLLVNGHRVNDNVFGQAEIGAEFGFDAATFERVEIIRGPASSIYGDSAFFAVVNVITRTGASVNGGSASIQTGSHGTQLVRGTVGRSLRNGVDFALSASVLHSDGVSRLYFPEFDTPLTNSGIAQGLDGERAGQFYGRLAYGGFTLTTAHGDRRKIVPTASVGTIFNEQVDREQTDDRHTLLDLEYGRRIGDARLTVRGSYDRFTYDGHYPLPGDDFGVGKVVGHSNVIGARWTVGARINKPLAFRQMLVAGAEFIDNTNQDQASRILDPAVSLFTSDVSSTQQAVYVQDELKLGRHVIVNGGLRYDRYQTFDRVTPRTALIVMPSPAQSFKYLYGRAFRSPNAYERNDFYFGAQVRSLKPESIDTHEFVWERYASDWLRTSVSTYWYKADRLITEAADPSTFLGLTYVNEGEVRARGVELESQMRLWKGAEGHLSYALQNATDHATGQRLTNSPRQMFKGRVSAPLLGSGSSVALEVLGIGRRLTVAGSEVRAATTANLTVIKPLGHSFELLGTARNLFDVAYADPASEQHRQDTIPRNGRTLHIGIGWKFAAK
jgi:outer membrane receptor for ferrienterochelin and colicins